MNTVLKVVPVATLIVAIVVLVFTLQYTRTDKDNGGCSCHEAKKDTPVVPM